MLGLIQKQSPFIWIPNEKHWVWTVTQHVWCSNHTSQLSPYLMLHQQLEKQQCLLAHEETTDNAVISGDDRLDTGYSLALNNCGHLLSIPPLFERHRSNHVNNPSAGRGHGVCGLVSLVKPKKKRRDKGLYECRPWLERVGRCPVLGSCWFHSGTCLYVTAPRSHSWDGVVGTCENTHTPMEGGAYGLLSVVTNQRRPIRYVADLGPDMKVYVFWKCFTI